MGHATERKGKIGQETGDVKVSQGEYCQMVRESAQAEMVRNGLECGVPAGYIRAMLSGKLDSVDVLGEDSLGSLEVGLGAGNGWGCLVAAVEGILDRWEGESQVAAVAANIREAVEGAIKARLDEVRMGQYSRWAEGNMAPYPGEPMDAPGMGGRQ